MTLVRVLRSAQVTLSHTFYVDETPTSAAGSVTYSIKRLDGTVVASGNASGPAPAGVYQVTVAGQANLDVLTIDWTATIAGSPVTARDHIEVVGGYLFGLAEARAMPPVLAPAKWTTAALAARRISVEQECEEICGQAFVPRFARARVPAGRTNLTLPHVNVRALRGVTVGGTVVSTTGLSVNPSGVVSGGTWPASWPEQQVVVEYEYGLDYPPEDLREAAMMRLRSRLSMGDTGVPNRALSFTVGDGGTYRLSVPSGKRVGIPEIDGVYERYTFDRGGFA